MVNEALGLSLVGVERERSAGDFIVDQVAENESSGNPVVIENQLEKSDHDHLGNSGEPQHDLWDGLALPACRRVGPRRPVVGIRRHPR